MLLIAFAIASQPSLTNITLHEWLAGLIIVPTLYHLVINWDWVAHVVNRLREKLVTLSGANLIVDIVLFVATVTVMLSGFMVLPGIVDTETGMEAYTVWLRAHGIASNVVIGSLIAHLLLHAQWIVETARRELLPAPGRHATGRARLGSAARGRR